MIETKFKQTEIGPIPEDWKVSSLRDVGEIKMCKRVLKFQTSDKGDIPFYKIGTFGKVADAYISRELYEEYLQKYNYPKKGDILLSAAGTIGRTVVFDGKPSYFQDSNIVWINNDESLILNSLLYYMYDRVSWVTESGTIPRIYNGIVHSIKFAHPTSLVEQEKIAKALSDVDALINELGELIAKKRDIKRGTMQQLLTGKKRLPGFTDEWKEQTLDDICSLSKGTQLNSSKMNDRGLYPVFNGGIAPSGYFTEYNTGANTIIISEGGNSCGFVNYVKEPFWRGGHCYALSNTSIDAVLLYHILKFNEASIMALRTGSGLPNIKKSTLANFCLKSPQSISEQQAIATILTDMDDGIQALEAKRDKYTAIKQGMMQELLTGKIRLV